LCNVFLVPEQSLDMSSLHKICSHNRKVEVELFNKGNFCQRTFFFNNKKQNKMSKLYPIPSVLPPPVPMAAEDELEKISKPPQQIFPVESLPITSVTVYPSQAMVIRQLNVKFTQLGEQQIVVDKMTGCAVNDSVRVSGKWQTKASFFKLN